VREESNTFLSLWRKDSRGKIPHGMSKRERPGNTQGNIIYGEIKSRLGYKKPYRVRKCRLANPSIICIVGVRE
jgi:hypothetical protein